MTAASESRIAAQVLIVDDVLDNLAVLHDALDETGYTVLVASNGKAAIKIAVERQPDVILLDAIMPEMDGFAVCVALKANMDTRHIPIIFMTGLTEAEHVATAFEAGGTDYVTKPVRPKEVLARIAAHIRTVQLMNQARSTLDAFGQAAIAVAPKNGKLIWQTPLARALIAQYFFADQVSIPHETPAAIVHWLKQMHQKNTPTPLLIIKNTNRLIINMVDRSSEEHWVILLREESDAAQIDALLAAFKLTKREAEVLYWAIKGKTSRDIGDILETSPRTVNKHLEHVFEKMGVETRTAAAALARSKLMILK